VVGEDSPRCAGWVASRGRGGGVSSCPLRGVIAGHGREVFIVEVIHPRCAGMDVSKRDAKVCIRIADKGRRGAQQTTTTWASTTRQILALREHLIAEQVTCVVMEATSDYWKPFYYLLSSRNRGSSHVPPDMTRMRWPHPGMPQVLLPIGPTCPSSSRCWLVDRARTLTSLTSSHNVSAGSQPRDRTCG
jgi:hypothetical protein